MDPARGRADPRRDRDADHRAHERRPQTALLPRWNYTHITDDVLPALREHGVGEAQITAMLVHNPARYFTGGQE